MYTVKKIETPDRGPMFAVVTGENTENVINRFLDEEEAKENCTYLNGGEMAEKKLAAAEKKAEEAAKKTEADHKARAGKAKSAPKANHEDEHKPRAHAARAKQHVRRMAPKPTRRHK